MSTVTANVHGLADIGSPGMLTGGSAGKRLLASGFNVNALRPCAESHEESLRTNATLMRDEWKQFDRTVQQVARERLVLTQFFVGRGLTYNLPNALGTMTLEWEQEKGDLVDAELTMSGLNEATKDRLEFVTVNMPIPLIHKEFFYNLRHLEAARRNGRNVETNHAQNATRKVAELVERLIIDGASIAGGVIYGLTTHPARKTLTKAAPWTTATGLQILSDVRRMVDALALPPNNMEGPYVLLIPRTLAMRLSEDYDINAANTDTILDRIRRIEGISDVIFTNRLSGNNVLLVQLTSDVIEIINGLPPTMVDWDSHGGFQHNFKIFAIQIPRIRSNGDGQTGIAHLS